MRDYVYVEAYLDENGDPAFRHCYLVAESDDEAYSEGYHIMRANAPPLNGQGLNDYVIDLSEYLGEADETGD